MRVTVVGCSGSLPGPAGAASCYLVEADGVSTDGRPRTYRLLLDLGSGALGPLQRLITVADLDAICLSHLHADHCLDLCGLYVLLRYHPEANGRRVPVHGPHGTAGRLARAYDLPEDPGMSAELDVHEWTVGEALAVGPLLVTPFPVEHPVEAYALRVTGPSEVGDSTVTFAYSGDTDTCEGLVSAAAGADVLLCEAAFHEGRDEVRGIHLTGLRAGETARDGGVGRLVLTHLPPWNDPQRSLSEARQVWPGRLDLAVPGMVLAL